MKKRTLPALLLILVTAVLTVLCALLLPDTIVTQFSLGSEGVTTMQKPLALLIPAMLGCGGGAAVLFTKNDDSAASRPLLIGCVGVLLLAVMLAVNLLVK